MEDSQMKKVYMFTIMSFVLLGALSNSFAASDATVAPEIGTETVGTVELEAVTVSEAAAAAESQDGLGQQLIAAVYANDLLEVKRLIELGAPVGGEALHAANWGEKFDAPADIIRALVAAGADVNAQDVNAQDTGFSTSIFFDCIRNHNADAVSVYLGAGVDFNICDELGNPLLLSVMHKAIRNRRERYVEGLERSLAMARLLILAGAYEDLSETRKGHVLASGKGLGREELVRKALADRKAYVSRFKEISSALSDGMFLPSDLVDLVKDYEEVDEEFAFLQDRARSLKEKVQAPALRYRTLKQYLRGPLQAADSLMELVLDYASENLS